LYPYSFENLYADLVNYWHAGRRPTYLGVDQYIQLRGSAMSTNNATDFIILGEGFFVVFDAINNKKYLTRNGRFLFNSLWFLINDDGYYVLGNDGEFINHAHFFAQSNGVGFRRSNDFFLLALPVVKKINRFTARYIYVSEFVIVEYSKVINGAIEANPVSLGRLLDTALLDVENNMAYNNKQGLIGLFHRRHNERRNILYEMRIRGTVTINEYFEILEYYDTILAKIQLLDNLLFNPVERR